MDAFREVRVLSSFEVFRLITPAQNEDGIAGPLMQWQTLLRWCAGREEGEAWRAVRRRREERGPSPSVGRSVGCKCQEGARALTGGPSHRLQDSSFVRSAGRSFFYHWRRRRRRKCMIGRKEGRSRTAVDERGRAALDDVATTGAELPKQRKRETNFKKRREGRYCGERRRRAPATTYSLHISMFGLASCRVKLLLRV